MLKTIPAWIIRRGVINSKGVLREIKSCFKGIWTDRPCRTPGHRPLVRTYDGTSWNLDTYTGSARRARTDQRTRVAPFHRLAYRIRRSRPVSQWVNRGVYPADQRREAAHSSHHLRPGEGPCPRDRWLRRGFD